MAAKFGWRLEKDGEFTTTTMYSEEGDFCSVKGFTSRTEAWMFIATYWVFLMTSKKDKAMELLKEFQSRVAH